MNLAPKYYKTFWTLSICSIIAAFDLIYQRLTLIFSFPQAQILPFVKAFANPALYPTDPMVQTRFSYLSLYSRYLGYLLRYFSNFELLIYVNHLFWLLISLMFAFKITAYVTRSDRSAIFATAVLFLQFPMFYGYSGHFRSLLNPSHNIVGFAFGTASVYALLQKRSYLAFVLLAAGTYFHSLSIFHLIGLFFLSELFELLSSRKVFRFSIKRYFPFFIFLILITPLLFLEMQNKRSYSIEDLKTFLNVNAQDSFPMQWRPGIYLNFVAFLTIIFFCIDRLRDKIDPSIQRWSLHLILSSVILSLAGLVGVEIFKIPFAIVFQATRCTVWISWIGSAYVATYVVLCFRRSWLFYFGILSILIAISTQVGFPFLIDPLFFIAIIFFQLSDNRRFWTWPRRDLFVSIFSFALVLQWAVALTGDEIAHWTFFDPVFAAMPYRWIILPIVIFWFSIFWYEPQKRQTFRNTLLACTSICISTLLFTLIFVFRNQVYSLEHLAWFETQIRAKGMSQPDEAFVTPPWRYGFRVLSERMPIGEGIDGTQQYFAPHYGDLYRERMRALGFDPSFLFSDQMNEIYEYNSMSKSHLSELKSKFGAKFYVIEKKYLRKETKPLGFVDADLEILFENDFYRIVRIP